MGKVACKNCDGNFEVEVKDLKFYEKIKVPPPTHCPTCRRQRRIALRNERHLYNRKCDLCEKDVIAVFPQKTDYTVYCNECWWKDSWNVMDYGRDYDFDRSFFEQFSEFEKSIPHVALFQEGDNKNCKYINYGLGNKSCYLALCAYCEDVYFSHGGIKSKSCMDCTKIMTCELCYECVDCNNCYNLLFSRNCNNCHDSYFLEDCIGSSNCFCSGGLRNKKFVFKNEQLSEEKYLNKIKDIKLTNQSIKDWNEALQRISLKVPKKFMNGMSNENVEGDYIDNCRNLYDCYDCLDNVENASYSDFCGINSYDFYDCLYFGIGSQLCYEINGASSYNNCKFIYYGSNLQDSEYCQCCYNCNHIFGCFGLNHKSYCILNKPYSKEEYEALLPRIIKHMKSTGEYGEFFPISISSMPYNETIAQEYYPMRKEEGIAKGYTWSEPEKKQHREGARVCKECDSDFMTISQEEAFYKKFNLPVPEICPECRHKNRFNQRNPRKLFDRKCMKCELPLKTSYAPERPEIIYCEKCYLESI
ncbi:MAG: hypothetical protein O3B47_04210 [bacterium]|nr:hypothetical protein [bacterium]